MARKTPERSIPSSNFQTTSTHQARTDYPRNRPYIPIVFSTTRKLSPEIIHSHLSFAHFPNYSPRFLQGNLKHTGARSRPARKPLRKTRPKILGPPDYRDPAFIAARMASRLLSLPPEIRLMIWEYALTSDSGNLYFDSATRRFDVSDIGAGLLSSCHLTAYETQYLPLQLNRLVFEVPTIINVDFMVFLRRLKRLEDALEWVMKIDVRFENIARDGDKNGSKGKICAFIPNSRTRRSNVV